MTEKSKLNVWVQGEKPDKEPVDEYYEGSSVICLVADDNQINGIKSGTFDENLAINYIHVLQQIIDGIAEEFPIAGAYTKLEKAIPPEEVEAIIERINREDE